MVAGCMGASVQTYGHAHIVTGSVRLKSNYEVGWVKVPGNFEWETRTDRKSICILLGIYGFSSPTLTL